MGQIKQKQMFCKKLTNYRHFWFHAYEHLVDKELYHMLLESNEQGRYSVMAWKADTIFRAKDGEIVIEHENEQKPLQGTDPLELLKGWMHSYKRPSKIGVPPMHEGALGFLSYDYVRYLEDIPTIATDDLQTPDVFFVMFDEFAILDKKTDTLWLISYDYPENAVLVQHRMEYYAQLFQSDIGPYKYDRSMSPMGEVAADSLTKEAFMENVEKAKAYIRAGDVFQVNLSLRHEESLLTHPRQIYRTLRRLNPSPYMAYIQTPDFQVVSGSPELLLKKEKETLVTRPIAGTRSRGRTKAEDKQLMETLKLNEKEQAEHVMLVDLERNDLGKVSEFGSVQVTQFMTIEKYSHVMHIVSEVVGKIRKERTGIDALKGMFPGGTITGAPKVRTMEIIEELEPTRRGIYTGSIGWLTNDGDMEFNIAIRTMYVKDGKVYVQAGAGIVNDSLPEAEYNESLKKAQALWSAKEASEEEI
nr:anthranilate synthase component I family protein [Massilibacterium senegalense]